MKSICSLVKTGVRPGAGLSVRLPHSLNCLIILATVCRLILMPSSLSWRTIVLMLLAPEERAMILNFVGLLVMQWVSRSQILVSGVDCSWCRGIHLPSLHWLFEDICRLRSVCMG